MQRVQESCLYDDMIQFSNQLKQSSHNVKALTKKRITHNSKQKSMEFSSSKNMQFSDIMDEQSNSKCKIPNIDKNIKRVSFTSGMKRRQRQIDHKLDQLTTQPRTRRISEGLGFNNIKSQSNTARIIFKQKQPAPTNGFASLQKAFNKGPLKQRQIQCWLNSILLQYCLQQKFDMTLQNPALKKFSIDRNSLLSQGIRRDHCSRLYKSLFVYSIGFNNLLKQTTNFQQNLMKTIWKVYAILLQYCAEGNFESLLAQIQRDKKAKIESLKQQIEKRQKIIEEIDETNREKNAKIFKELKFLREENQKLKTEKQVLQEQFKKTEQAFNEEVVMRLKFESKINEIHGIHKELSDKHKNLYDFYKVKEFENTNKEKKIQELTKKKMELTLSEEELMRQNKQQIKSISEYNDAVLEMEESITKLKHKLIQENTKYQDLTHILSQSHRKNNLTERQMKNLQASFNAKVCSNELTSENLYKSLQDNKSLNDVIYKQTQQIGQLLKQSRQFNSSIAYLRAEIDVLTKKTGKQIEEIQRLKATIQQSQQKILQGQIQVQHCQKTLQLNEKDIQAYKQCIEKMKEIKNQTDEQLQISRKKINMFDEVLREKQSKIAQYEEKIKQLQSQRQNLLVDVKSMKSKISLLEQKLFAQEELSKRQIEKLKLQRDSIKLHHDKISIELQEKSSRLEIVETQLRQLMDAMKDQKFERTNLDLRYKQSLQVVQSDQNHITQLNRQISQLKELVSESKRKMHNAQYVLKQKTIYYERTISKLTKDISELQHKTKFISIYIHPMVYEEACSRALEHFNKNQQTKVQLANINLQCEVLRDTISTQSVQNKMAIEVLNEQHEAAMERKIAECSFIQSKLKEVQKKNQELKQIVIERKASEGGLRQVQRQEKYMMQIKQKVSHIQQLQKQLHQIHDVNSELRRQILQIKDTIQSQEVVIEVKNKEIHLAKAENQKLQQRFRAIQAHNHELKALLEKEKIASKSIETQRMIKPIQQQHKQRVNAMQQSQIPIQSTLTRNANRGEIAKKMRSAVKYYHR